MPRGVDIQIIEYHNGEPMHYYDGILECASTLHCSPELIKGLIFTGQAFPYLEEKVTFDIHAECKCHIERRPRSLCKATRYYMFDIVDDSKGEERRDIERSDEGKDTKHITGNYTV